MRRSKIMFLVFLVVATMLLLQVLLVGPAAAKNWKALGTWAPNVLSMTYDADSNRLYCGTSNRGCVYYDFNIVDWVDISKGTPLQDKWVSSVVLCMGSTPYAATNSGVYSYNGKTWVLNGLNARRVNCLAYDSVTHTLYAGTDAGVYKSDLDTPGWLYTNGPLNLYPGNAEYVNCLLWDAETSNLFAGTSGVSGSGGVWSMVGGWTSIGLGHHTSVMSLSKKGTLYAGVSSAGHDWVNTWGVWMYSGGGVWTDTGLAAYRADAVTSMAWQGDTLCAGTMYYGIWYKNSGWTQDAEVKGSTNCLLYLPSTNALFCGSVNGVVYQGTLPGPASNFYLAEGSFNSGFSTYISIENPNTSAVHAAITYNTNTGNVSGGTLTLPAKSQTTVNPVSKLRGRDFSTKVVCTEGKTIAVDRTMSWTGAGAASPEGHSSVGVIAPAKTWYLPEGSSAWGFETWTLVQNPNSLSANVTLTYMIDGAGPRTVSHPLKANSRDSFPMEKDLKGKYDASIKVTSDIPVIPERSVYKNNKREGHNSIGTTTPANDYYLAEGSTAWGFTTFVLVANPNSKPADITLTYMKSPSGTVTQTIKGMKANSRKTVNVGKDVPGMANTDFSTRVRGTLPIIAERAMYWGKDTPLGEACHDSIGLSSAHTSFYLPDGQTSEGRETWTLIQNPNSADVKVEISYFTPTGKGNVTRTETIAKNSRRTFDMYKHSKITGRAAIMVTCKTSGKKILSERSMYWNRKGAGTCTIGGYSD